MTDREKLERVIAEIERLRQKVMGVRTDFADGQKGVLTELLSFIDSLEKEPINTSIDFEQELYKNFGQVKDFTLAVKIAKRFYDMGRNSQEPVSEDLEEVDDELYDEYIRFLNYHKKGSIETQNLLLCARHFANWQKKQDQETIELAEDHAMLAGMVKGKEEAITKACKYLQEHREEVETEDNGISGWISDEFVEKFKKAMNDE